MLQLKSLVTIKMNKIFPCLACYGQKFKFVVRKSRQKKHKLVEENAKDEFRTTFFKSHTYDPF